MEKEYRLNLIGRSIYADDTDPFQEISYPGGFELIANYTTGYYRVESGLEDDGVTPWSFVLHDTEVFSGIKTLGDFSIGKSLVQNTLNIGNKNVVSTNNFGHIIGHNNILSQGNNSSYALGERNKIINSNDSFVFGIYNSTSGSPDSISIGNSNTINSSQWNSLALGYSNIISGKSAGNVRDVYMIGWSNSAYQSTGVKIFGDTNTSINVDDASILGENNDISNSSDIQVFGNNLDVFDSAKISIVGIDNNVSKSQNSSFVGEENDLVGATGIHGIGENNLFENTSYTYFVGKHNEITNCVEGNILGQDNLNSNSIYTTIVGNSNEINDADYSRFFGDHNKLFGGMRDFTLIGSTNQGTGDSTDHTTFLIGDGNDFTHLSRSHIVGNTNEIYNGEYINLFGYSNRINNSVYTTIIGDSNASINSSYSYVFGRQNNISGDKTLIIGNNNLIRTGDYNSVVVGIGYEPTGSPMVAKVVLASVDSSIEIDPSNISIKSNNIPTVNGQQIVLKNELDSFNGALIKNQLLINDISQPFYDSEYNDLPDLIEMQNFAWTSGNRNGVFAKGIAKATNLLFLQNFNIFGPTSYVNSGQGFNLIYGTDNKGVNSPQWMIVDNVSGIYNRNSKYDLFKIPQTGWTVTGFGLSEGTSNTSVKILMGSRTGLASVFSSIDNKTLYFPYYY
jgi:hypothetical protein